MHHIESESLERLFAVISQLEDPEQCRKFFEDICTVKELLDLAQRLDVAVLLHQGVNYQTISQQVGVSTATISRQQMLELRQRWICRCPGKAGGEVTWNS